MSVAAPRSVDVDVRTITGEKLVQDGVRGMGMLVAMVVVVTLSHMFVSGGRGGLRSRVVMVGLVGTGRTGTVIVVVVVVVVARVTVARPGTVLVTGFMIVAGRMPRFPPGGMAVGVRFGVRIGTGEDLQAGPAGHPGGLLAPGLAQAMGDQRQGGDQDDEQDSLPPPAVHRSCRSMIQIPAATTHRT